MDTGRTLGAAMSRWLDARVRPAYRLGARDVSAFQVCGITGFVLALILSFGLVLYQGLSEWVVGAVVLAAVATVFVVAAATKVVLGKERLVYYHHEIAVVAVAALVVWALGEPVLPYLDATMLGIGTFLVCGRLGCLMVGCCHGRPHAWGVCYRPEHATVGFASSLVGVRLFPVQAAESLWVLGVVGVGGGLVIGGHAPGSAFAWYVVAYDVGRFTLEFVRGDPERAYVGGFSEGQWMSLLLMVAVVLAEWAGALPFRAWHVAATGGMVAVMVGLIVHRSHRRVPTYALLSACHTKELAEGLREATWRSASDVVSPVTTSLGIRLSAGAVAGPSGPVEHYTLSAQDGAMDAETARALGTLICRLRPAPGTVDVVSSAPGVFHLVRRGPSGAPDRPRTSGGAPGAGRGLAASGPLAANPASGRA